MNEAELIKYMKSTPRTTAELVASGFCSPMGVGVCVQLLRGRGHTIVTSTDAAGMTRYQMTV